MVTNYSWLIIALAFGAVNIIHYSSEMVFKEWMKLKWLNSIRAGLCGDFVQDSKGGNFSNDHMQIRSPSSQRMGSADKHSSCACSSTRSQDESIRKLRAPHSWDGEAGELNLWKWRLQKLRFSSNIMQISQIQLYFLSTFSNFNQGLPHSLLQWRQIIY